MEVFKDFQILTTDNIYFGMYFTTHSKQVVSEHGTNTVSYVITRFGILYKVVDGVFIDIVTEKLINEDHIDPSRSEKINKILKNVPENITVGNILNIVKETMNIQSDRDYIESAERNDNINFDKKSDNNDMFNGIVEECKRKQN